MLIVAGTFHVDPARRDEFIRGREAAMVTSRAERGCIEYVFAADPIVPGKVVLYERWEDKDALRAHLESMRIAREQSAMPPDPGVPILSSEIQQYEISAVGKVGS
jgi:quinol monooxygenase YgiN